MHEDTTDQQRTETPALPGEIGGPAYYAAQPPQAQQPTPTVAPLPTPEPVPGSQDGPQASFTQSPPPIQNIYITQQVTQQQQAAPTVLVTSGKSVVLSLVLTFFFGPLGMFYSTVTGAVIMLIASIVLGALTLGFGILVTWPVCMIWGAIAASNYNKQLAGGVMTQISR